MRRVRRTGMLRLVVLGLCPLGALSKAYWKFDEVHHHRRAISKCKPFECPAYQRPVRKLEDEFRPYAPKICPNHRELEPDEYEKALSVCCTSKYVCSQTCGIGFQECYDAFWSCSERICRTFKEEQEYCLAAAVHNDLHYLTMERVMAHFMPSPEGDEVCTQFHELQRSSCDCVPQKDMDEYQVARLEDFLKHHEPHQLNKKGKAHGKEHKAFWKSWKGKRPSMFFSLMMKYPGETFKHEHFDKDAAPPVRGKSGAKSARPKKAKKPKEKVEEL